MTSTNMDCPRAHELLSDHLEGALNGILHGEVEAHLAGCMGLDLTNHVDTGTGLR